MKSLSKGIVRPKECWKEEAERMIPQEDEAPKDQQILMRQLQQLGLDDKFYQACPDYWPSENSKKDFPRWAWDLSDFGEEIVMFWPRGLTTKAEATSYLFGSTTWCRWRLAVHQRE